MSALIASIQQRPKIAFAAFLAVHFCLWTALPTILYPNLPLDLIEALTYGREWQLGYDKLPPLPWWLVEIAYRLVGHDVVYYTLAQLAVIAAFIFVWAVARRMVGPVGALLAVLIVDGLHYFNYTAAKFNHDVIQLPLWAMAGYAYWRALRQGRLVDWIVLGASIGLAVWAKYFIVVLALPLALFVLVDRQARRSLATPGPYLAALVALLIAAPHLVWLVQNDFLPFGYADARATPVRGIADHLVHPLQFAYLQLGYLLPSLLIAIPLIQPASWPTPPSGDGKTFDWRIVTVLAFGPAMTVIVLSALTGRGTVSMWGYPLWLFLGLWILLTWPRAIDRNHLAGAFALWTLACVGYGCAFIANYAILPHYDDRERAVMFPGERLGAEISARFRAATGSSPAYVIGSMWTGGNVGHYAPERPRVLIDGNPQRAPWIDLADLRAKGAVVVWSYSDVTHVPDVLRRIAPDAQLQLPFTLTFHRSDRTVAIGWAIMPPEK